MRTAELQQLMASPDPLVAMVANEYADLYDKAFDLVHDIRHSPSHPNILPAARDSAAALDNMLRRQRDSLPPRKASHPVRPRD